MKNLFVGCKVRIVQNGFDIAPGVAPFLNKVGIITAKVDSFKQQYIKYFYGASVAWEVFVEGGTTIYADSPCLEPILPSGHTASTETHEQCMARLRQGVVDELPS